jgi:phage baseplate assembly protein V
VSDALLNLIRREASAAANRTATARYGIIDTYDPDTFAVKVRVQPEDVITGWLPLGTPWVGDGWGMFAAPTPGDQVLIEFAEGDPESGVLIARLFSDAARPLAVPAGEFWLVHKNGQFIKLTNDGIVTINAPASLIIDGEVYGSESISVAGNCVVGNGASGTFTTPAGQTVTVQDGIVTNIF